MSLVSAAAFAAYDGRCSSFVEVNFMVLSLHSNYTALVTPFSGGLIDWDRLDQLAAFQVQNGCGLLANGTTAETPALSADEQHGILDRVLHADGNAIAGTGGNHTDAVLAKTAHAVDAGARACLLVDAYYNGPSSHELRTEYHAPVASAFPETAFIPYVIPGRTGCELSVEDLALLTEQCSNVVAVKEATGNVDRMVRTRRLLPHLSIYSGDDDLTFSLMTHSDIRAQGVISVMSNLVPIGVRDLVHAVHRGDLQRAQGLNAALQHLFGMVVVKTSEATRFGPVTQKWRNPLPVKTAMAGLGLIDVQCRRPLGRMSASGVAAVQSGVQRAYDAAPELFDPLQSFFGIDVQDRLAQPWRESATARMALA